MLKFFLVAHLTYENQWVSLRNKIRTFGFFGTPYCAPFTDFEALRKEKVKKSRQAETMLVGNIFLPFFHVFFVLSFYMRLKSLS